VCGFAMADVREQHVCIEFCLKLRKTAAETHQMFKQAFGDNSLGHTQIYDWYKRLKMAQHRLMMTIIRKGHQLALHQEISR
jgi:hypothetical protein